MKRTNIPQTDSIQELARFWDTHDLTDFEDELEEVGEEERDMTNYWVVGAAWGGTDYQDQRFVKQGIWMLGRENEDDPQRQRASEMKPKDRIAIKRMKGQGQTGIRILHLGIVKEIISDTKTFICTVDWVATDLDRDIAESRGCFQSIHGPFEHDAWIQEVFCL